MAVVQDLVVEQGASFYARFASRRESTIMNYGDYADAKFRVDYDSVDYEQFTVTTSNQFVTLEMTPTETAQLTPGNYVYDLKVGDVFTRCSGYNDSSGNLVLYTAEEVGELGYFVLRAYVGLETVTDDSLIDFDNDGYITATDTLMPLRYALTQSPEFRDTAFDAWNSVLGGGSFQTNIRTILNSNITALDPGRVRLLQGRVKVTPEVTR